MARSRARISPGPPAGPHSGSSTSAGTSAEPGRRSRGVPDAGHIPGAIFVDLDTDLTGRHGAGPPSRSPPRPPSGPDGAAGIGDGTGRGRVRRRRRLGRRAAVVDARQPRPRRGRGARRRDQGLGRGRRPAHDRGPGALPPAELHLRRCLAGVIDRERSRRGSGRVVLLDARAGPRYRGETEPIDPVAGHIPTAINAPIDGNLADDGRFLPPASSRPRFAAARRRRTRSAEVVTSCGSGISALPQRAGDARRRPARPDPVRRLVQRLVPSGYPVATGPEPGEPPE